MNNKEIYAKIEAMDASIEAKLIIDQRYAGKITISPDDGLMGLRKLSDIKTILGVE